jgi:hypothetical protein
VRGYLHMELRVSRLTDLSVNEDTISARLTDGRIVSAPLAWSWRLSEATPEQRAHFEIPGAGEGVHWPEIGEDVSVHGTLSGVPARRPKAIN